MSLCTRLLRKFLSAVLLLSLAYPSFADTYQFKKFAKVHVFESDILLDDIAMFIAAAGSVMKGTRGENVVIITSGENTYLQAQAIYKLLSSLGKDRVTVIPGEAVYSNYKYDYLIPYTAPENTNIYLEPMARIEGPTLEKHNPVNVLRELKESGTRMQLYSFANPHNLNKFFLEGGGFKDQVDSIVSMGIYRRTSNTQGTTGYNTNTGMEDQVRFLQLVEGNYKLYTLPSNLFYKDNIVKQTEAARNDFLNQEHSAINSVMGALTQFQKVLGDQLFRMYGPDKPWVQLFDPTQGPQAWPQDLLSYVVAQISAGELKTREVRVNIDTSSYSPGNLGQNVTLADQPGTGIFELTELPVTAITEYLNQSYKEARFIPELKVDEILKKRSKKAKALITKASIDDLAIARVMATALGEDLKLIYTESVNAGTNAEIFRNLANSYGSPTDVVNGTGNLKSGIKNLEAEEYMVSRGFGKGVVPKREALAQDNVNNPDGYRAIINLLNNNPDGVDLFVTTSVHDLNQALSERPDLISRISTLHLMGGSRDDSKLTRNWLLDEKAIQEVFIKAKSAKIKTYIYSSGMLGGSVTDVSYPETTLALRALANRFGIEKGLNNLRLQWNTAIRDVFKNGMNIEGNYGSPLAYVMAMAAVTGEEFFKFADGDAVNVNIEGGKAKYEKVDAKDSNIVLLKSFNEVKKGFLDQIISSVLKDSMSYLENAKQCRRLPSQLPLIGDITI